LHEACGAAQQPTIGETHAPIFAHAYDRRATVTRCELNNAFALTRAFNEIWNGNRLSIDLVPARYGAHVRSAHRGWTEANDHYRTSSSCCAIYLRRTKRHIENGEQVLYAIPLDV
jgi:hypothetical protein